jgi:hypothetical protein
MIRGISCGHFAAFRSPGHCADIATDEASFAARASGEDSVYCAQAVLQTTSSRVKKKPAEGIGQMQHFMWRFDSFLM